MENKNEKLRKVMGNIMAALHAFGVEYDVNTYGFESFKSSLEDIRKDCYGASIEEIRFEAPEFAEKLREFVEQENYGRTYARYWADDGECVVVQLCRLYQMTEEDWKEWANWYGFDDPTAAQYECGDPDPSYVYLNVRVEKENTERFVNKVAPYCW